MLVRQDVAALRAVGNQQILPRTETYAEGDLSQADLLRLVERVAASPSLLAAGRVCVLYGYGSSTRRLYRALRTTPGVEVVWDADFLPLWWMKPLGLFAAAHGGLIRIRDVNVLSPVFEQMTHLAMAELYCFREEVWNPVLEYVKRHTWRSFIGTVIGAEDPTYFCIGADGDSPETYQLCRAWVSFGGVCPDDLARQLDQL